MRGLIAGVGMLVALALPSAAAARDTIVESFDGTPIVTHFYEGKGATAQAKQPTILIGHGWGGSGEPATGAPAPYIAAGYNVVTWDARGFGGSGGTIMIDHPEFEARDVQALIDYVAQQPEAQMETAGDPLVGMAGPSYGGGIQFITAARDKRVDVIAPTVPWHNLLESLYPRESLKNGWDLALIGVGIPQSIAPGILSPAGIQTGHQSQQFYDAVINGSATGQLTPATQAWFDEHGPDIMLDKVRVPTLIAQGTVDTLFDLDQADRNFEGLRANKVPLKMMWFCGGHAICNVDHDSTSSVIGWSGHVANRQLAWFDRHLKGRTTANTGPVFEWIDQNGSWHASDGYPVRETGRLRGSLASGAIPLTPGFNPKSGVLIQADPDPSAPIRVPIEAKGGEEIVGSPRVSFTYSAGGTTTTRTDGITHVFARIVDRERNVVAGNQDTPIPIVLDGREHKVSDSLVRIAQKASAKGYDLEIVGQSNLFDAQRATGLVQITGLDVSLPTTVPVVAGEGDCLRPSRIGFKIHRVKGTRVVRVDAYVNGARVLRGTGRDIKRVVLSKLPRTGKMTVRIVARHNTGSRVVSTRSWSGCTKGKPSVRVLHRR